MVGRAPAWRAMTELGTVGMTTSCKEPRDGDH